MSPKIYSTRTKITLKKGKFLRFVQKNGYEYVERVNKSRIVIMLAVTDDQKLVLIQQLRIPIGKEIIGYPAGLTDILRSRKQESLIHAAKRELLEETGFKAKKMIKVFQGPTASGITSDEVNIFLAKGLKRVGRGGGDQTENIKVHLVPLKSVEKWLKGKRRAGFPIGPNVYAGLYFLKRMHILKIRKIL